MKKYPTVAIGGTFDRLHRGHHKLLDTAFSVGNTVIVGVTSDTFPHTKKAHTLIQPFPQRVTELKTFIHGRKKSATTSIIKLQDPYGPTLSATAVDALVVTPHTLPGGIAINKRRQQLHQKKLPIIIAPLIQDDSGQYLSSTRIRLGQVNREGVVYAHLFSDTLTISAQQRKKLQPPQGDLHTQPNPSQILSTIKALQPPSKIAVVGDVTTAFFLQHHLPFNYAVFDHRVGRQPSSLLQDTFTHRTVSRVHNQPGEISKQLSAAIRRACRNTSGLISITGEDDLAAVPYILLLPLGSLVFYGQPHQGIVVVTVSETTKGRLESILSR